MPLLARRRLRTTFCVALPLTGTLLLGACEDASQSPTSRPERALSQQPIEGGNPAPIDLIYVCGNKFLAVNSHRSSVHVTYRVVGSTETGSLTLPPAPLEDPAYSEIEMETAKTGIVELYRDGERVTRRRNLRYACGAEARLVAPLLGASLQTGSWTAPFPWPVVALHLSLLPDGRVLSWGLSGQSQVWDPATGDFDEFNTGSEVFCSGHSFLGDGRLLVAGGHLNNDRGLADINIFSLSPAGPNWTPTAPMRRGRWYPTNTTLANGSVVILAGRDEVGDEVAEPEVWSPGGVRQLTGASLVLPYYPRTFLAPNGRVFYAGELQTTRYLTTSGTGSWTTVGNRRYGTRAYGAAVMYEEGKILYVGGGRTTNTAEIINLNAAAPAWQWTGSMAFARRNLNATVLPTGEVLVTGGSSGPGSQDLTQAVRAAEIWNPATGVWTLMSSNAVRRTYHSTTLLLPDGRVLHTGSGEANDMPDERNAELYSPPYLFGGSRPTITDAPALVGYGTTFRIATPQAATISRVSLIRLGSVTHSFDMNQRLSWLLFEREPGGLNITAPANGNRAPPGHYMLFILDANGVPSVARIVKVGSESEPTPGPNGSPTAAFIVGCSNSTCTFADRSTDPESNLKSWSWNFGDGNRSTARDPNHNYGAPGTYTATLTVTDGEGVTGTATRQVTVPGQQFPITLALTTRTTSTQQIVTLNWTRAQGPSLYVYRNGLVLIATPNDGQQVITKNATGAATYIFKLCEAGTTICSNPATANFGGGAPPPNAPPNANFTPNCTELACRFTDGSSDTDGSITGWQWEFGDGSTSTQRNPSYTYASGGTYAVKLTVTDNSGGQGSRTKQVEITGPASVPPTANFTSSCDDQDCSFTDTSTDPGGSVEAWAWDFGDGNTSDERHPQHSFGSEGTYTVRLTVTDGDALEGTIAREITVTAEGFNSPPAADFTSSCNNLACTFTDRSSDSDGSVTGWAWSFGDGQTSTAQNPGRTYTGAGTYTVTLTATDNEGGTGERSAQVTVTAAPPPPPPTGITLTATGKEDATKQYITYRWSGATGDRVDLYRNNVRIANTPNDGFDTRNVVNTAPATYVVKVCLTNSTTCSNQVTVVFN